MRRTYRSHAWSGSVAGALLGIGLSCVAGAARATTVAMRVPQPALQVESGAGGEVGLDARGVPIADVLRPLAAQGDFEVFMDESVPRPLVYLTVPMSPLPDVLQELLRGRNYALVYNGESGAPSRVILLAPSTPGKSAPPARVPVRVRTPSGPTVVSR